jgi:hypothetical protein
MFSSIGPLLSKEKITMKELRFAVDFNTKHLMPTLYHYQVGCDAIPYFSNANSAVYLRDALGYAYRFGSTELPAPHYPPMAPYKPTSIIVYSKEKESACTAYLYYDIPRLADLAFAILFSRGADRLGLAEINIEEYIVEGAKTIFSYSTTELHRLLPLVVLSPMRSRVFWDECSSWQILRKCERTLQKASERDFQSTINTLERDAQRLIETKLVEP